MQGEFGFDKDCWMRDWILMMRTLSGHFLRMQPLQTVHTPFLWKPDGLQSSIHLPPNSMSLLTPPCIYIYK